MRRADVAVVGAGITGIACALAAALRGHSVVLFERGPRAQGASSRNSGVIVPTAQPRGALRRRALRSRRLWLEIAHAADFWLDECGQLLVAYQSDELAVIEEFAASNPDLQLLLLTPEEAVARAPAVRKAGLLGALWSPHEMCVDAREALRHLPLWLEQRHGVTVCFDTHVASAETGRLVTAARETWMVGRTLVCTGAETAALYPQILQSADLQCCKVQMLRTRPQPSGWRLGPHLVGGPSLVHLPAFRGCPSVPTLRRRLENQMGDLLRLGIQATVTQNGLGEILLGSSHERGRSFDPVDPEPTCTLLREALGQFVDLPTWELSERWHAVHMECTHGRSEFVACPEPDVWIVNGLGSAALTMSFGLAEELWDVIESGSDWAPRG